MTKIAIHQPMYLPYLGIFNKMKNVDVFVFLDDAKYSDGYYYNRNRIKTPRGDLMLTVPIRKLSGEKLNEIKIENNIFWQKKHMKSLIVYYEKSGHFTDYRDFFEKVHNTNMKWKKLHDLNMTILVYLMKQLDIDTPFYFSSDLLKNYPPLKGTQRLVEICRELDVEIYLSGVSGRNYLDEKLFEENNIMLEFQKYTPKEYKQLYGDFIPNLSAIDLLFNLGDEAYNFV